MGRKKEDKDAAASFFGEDDLGWLEDEESLEAQRAAARTSPTPQALPVAPPAPALRPAAPAPKAVNLEPRGAPLDPRVFEAKTIPPEPAISPPPAPERAPQRAERDPRSAGQASKAPPLPLEPTLSVPPAPLRGAVPVAPLDGGGHSGAVPLEPKSSSFTWDDAGFRNIDPNADTIVEGEPAPVLPVDVALRTPAPLPSRAAGPLPVDAALRTDVVGTPFSPSRPLRPSEIPTMDLDAATEEARDLPPVEPLGRFDEIPAAVPEPPEPDVFDDAELPADVSEEVTVFADDLGDSDDETPLVQTKEPPPGREAAPSPGLPEAGAAMTFSPPDAGAPSLALSGPSLLPSAPVLAPGGDAEEWAAMVSQLVAEAGHRSGADRGRLLVDAARLRLQRLADAAGAEALAAEARAAGADLADVHRVFAEAAVQRQAWDSACASLTALGDALSGAPAADALREAASLALHRLGRADIAVARLRAAARKDPSDAATLAMLRDALGEGDDPTERVDVLGRLAELSAGPATARLHLERGEILLGLGRVADAQAAFEGARASDPSLVPAFLALEALFLQRAQHAERAALYASEAARVGQPEPAWWGVKAARAYVDAGLAAEAEAALEAAVATGDPAARREQQAFFARARRFDAMATSLEGEANATEGPGRAWALWHLGRLRERELGDAAGALSAYRAAAEADPAAIPAADGVARLLLRMGATAELLAFWDVRLAAATTPAERAAVQFRIAEIAEGGGDDERARVALEAVVSDAPTEWLPALEALQRVYTRLGRWMELAALYERRGDREQQPSARALQYARAGDVYQTRGGDLPRARAAYERALDLVPDHPVALDACVEVLEKLGEWAPLAAALRSAGEATGSLAHKTSLFYRAGRVYADRTDDLAGAVECLRQALQVDAEFVPALDLLKDLSGRSGPSDEVYRLHASEAGASTDPAVRAWRWLAAADAAEGLDGVDARYDLLRVLEEQPGHTAALAALELRCLRDGDRAALAESWRRAVEALPGADRARFAAQLAELLHELGDTWGAGQALAELRGAAPTGPGRPLRALAMTAAAQQHWDEAARLLEPLTSDDDRLERARLLATRAGDVAGASVVWRELALAGDARGALGALASGDPELARRGHAVLSEQEGPSAFRAAHAGWAAALAESAGEVEAALPLARRALELRPGSAAAFEAVRRLLVASRDADGLRALYAAHRAEDRTGLAEAVEAARGDALALWAAAAEGGGLCALAQLERAQATAADWRGVYATLERRAALVTDPSAKGALDARRRWVLAEKLADTDEAWELYGRMHEERPDDRDVTEALAGIAGARGDVNLGVQFLDELARTAPASADAARYRRRIAEIHVGAGNVGAARQAWLDALDHQSDDMEALAGLERLAADDPAALVGVLQRKANLVAGEARLSVLRELARLPTGARGGPHVAIDAWRAVLEASPTDREALDQLLALAEGQGQWDLFVEVGDALSRQLEGAERTELLARVGFACVDELGRDDGARFLEAAVAAEPPHVEAARRLERLLRQHGDLPGAVRALVRQAEGLADPAEKVTALVEAARIEAAMRHDRESAGALYARVLELDPENEAALTFRAELLFAAGRGAEALPLYQRLEGHVERRTDLDDFDARIEVAAFWYRVAELLREGGHPREALARYDRALELNPTHLPTLETAGPLYMEMAEWKKAERVYRQLLQLTGGIGDKAKLADTYTRLGLVERALGAADKAAKRFNKALEIVTNHVGALRGMALILEDAKDWNAALNYYNNVIYHATSHEDVVHAYMTKGRILDEQMGRADKAGQHYERSLAFDANQPVALLRLAELAMRRSAWHEAGGLAQRGLQLVSEPGPVRADLLLVWAAARKASGDVAGGRAAVVEAMALQPALRETLGDAPLDDLDKLRVGVAARLPR